MVVDAAHGLDELGQMPQARPQHNGNGMLHRGLAGLNRLLANHADPLLLEEASKDALPLGQVTGIGTIVDDVDAA